MASPQSEQNADRPPERPGFQKSVFVAIPSGEPFDSVYTDLIEKPLTDAGFQVVRAQDLVTARDIIADIVEGIQRADIVVADLTDLNPNVFYEVGLAHARTKPVVLLTQDIDEVPFDLRQYRVIQYGVDYRKFQHGVEQLSDTVSRVAADPRLARGPFSDFSTLRSEQAPPEAAPERKGGTDDDDDLGLVDYQAQVLDAFEGAVPIIERVGETMKSLTARTTRLSNDMQKAKGPGGDTDPRRLRTILRAAARDFEAHTSELRDERIQYEARITPVEDNLERLIEKILERDVDGGDDILDSLDSLRETRGMVESARVSCGTLAATISELPSLERRFNRSLRTLSEEVIKLGDVYESTVRFFDRGFAVMERRSQDAPAD